MRALASERIARLGADLDRGAVTGHRDDRVPESRPGRRQRDERHRRVHVLDREARRSSAPVVVGGRLDVDDAVRPDPVELEVERAVGARAREVRRSSPGWRRPGRRRTRRPPSGSRPPGGSDRAASVVEQRPARSAPVGSTESPRPAAVRRAWRPPVGVGRVGRAIGRRRRLGGRGRLRRADLGASGRHDRATERSAGRRARRALRVRRPPPASSSSCRSPLPPPSSPTSATTTTTAATTTSAATAAAIARPPRNGNPDRRGGEAASCVPVSGRSPPGGGGTSGGAGWRRQGRRRAGLVRRHGRPGDAVEGGCHLVGRARTVVGVPARRGS